jgi:hypothetical protein
MCRLQLSVNNAGNIVVSYCGALLLYDFMYSMCMFMFDVLLDCLLNVTLLLLLLFVCNGFICKLRLLSVVYS